MSAAAIAPAKSTGLPSSLLVFLTPYNTGLLGGRTFLLVLKKLHFWCLTFISDFDLFFVCIHCLIIGSLQPVTKYMLFDNYNYCFLNHELITLMFVILACIRVFVAPSRDVARRVVIFLSCALIYLILRVNLPGLTHPDLTHPDRSGSEWQCGTVSRRLVQRDTHGR